MKKDSSGNIYRFKLEHNLGYAYAEVLDFTDISDFDGRVIYVFKQIDKEPIIKMNINDIKNSGILIGPLLLFKFPSTKGNEAWKIIGKTSNFIANTFPVSKWILADLSSKYNWNDFYPWYKNVREGEIIDDEYKHDEIRFLETAILQSPSDVVLKTTFMHLILKNEDINNYYEFSCKISHEKSYYYYEKYIELVNTYFSEERTLELINNILHKLQ